jgi:TniQ
MRSGLPLQTRLRNGFSLADVIDEMAVLLNVPVSSCLRVLQLHSDNQQQFILNRPLNLNESESKIFAHLFHAQIDQVNEMTLQYFAKRLLRSTRSKQATERQELLLERVLGFDRTTTRICPVCIAEGRPRRLVWQSRWLFACTRHKVLLVDRCPSCGESLASRRRSSRVPRLYCCDNQPTRSERCNQRLDLIPITSLSEQPEVLWAQHRVEACIQGLSFTILGKKRPAIEFLRLCDDLIEPLFSIPLTNSSTRHQTQSPDQPEGSSLFETEIACAPIGVQAQRRSRKYEFSNSPWSPANLALTVPMVLSLVNAPNLQSLEDTLFHLISEACSLQKVTPQQVVQILEAQLARSNRSHFHTLFQELRRRVRWQYHLFDQHDPISFHTLRLSMKFAAPGQELSKSKMQGERNAWLT